MTINRNECDQNIPSFQFVVTDLHGSANITMLISYCKLYLTKLDNIFTLSTEVLCWTKLFTYFISRSLCSVLSSSKYHLNLEMITLEIFLMCMELPTPQRQSRDLNPEDLIQKLHQLESQADIEISINSVIDTNTSCNGLLLAQLQPGFRGNEE